MLIAVISQRELPIQRKQMPHANLMGLLAREADAIRNKEYPKLSHSYAHYKEAYYHFQNDLPKNWIRKDSRGTDMLENDLEVVWQYENPNVRSRYQRMIH